MKKELKFTELSAGSNYERVSDGKIFKKIGERFLCASEGETFKETDQISLSDRFVKTHKQANDSLMDIFHTWKSGDISEKQAAHDRLLLGFITRIESLESKIKELESES
jgi:transposase-like protein